MKIIINDTEMQITHDSSVLQTLEVLNIDPKGVAVAVNRACIPRAQHSETILKDGDHLEILSPMVGG